MPTRSADFKFDSNRSIDENLAAFVQTLHAEDPELAALFEVEFQKLLPLPLEAAARTAARTRFNSAIATGLDSLIKP